MSQDNIWRAFNSDTAANVFQFSNQAAGRESGLKLTAAVTSNVITVTTAAITVGDFEAIKIVIAGADSSQTLSSNIDVASATPAAVVMNYSALTPLKDALGRSYVRLNITPYPTEGKQVTGYGLTQERNLIIGTNLSSFVLIESRQA